MFWRAVIVCGLLVAEGLAVSIAFDLTDLFVALDVVEIRLVTILPLVIIVAYAVTRTGERAPLPSPGPVRPAGIVAHVVAYAVFVATMAHVSGQPEDPGALFLAAWILAGFATVVTLVLAVFPVSVIAAFVRRERSTLVLAAVVGTVASVVAAAGDALWPVIADSTLEGSRFLLSFFFDDARTFPADRVLGARDFEVIVNKACSGTEGVGLLATLTGAYLVVRRRTLVMSIAWILLPAAIVLALVGNVVRITMLMVIGATGSPELAVAGFHSKAGWLLACLIALVLTAIAERSLTRDAPGLAVDRPTALYLGPLLLTLALQLVTGLFIIDFDHLYPLRFVVVAFVATIVCARVKPARPGLVWPMITGVLVFTLWWWLAERPDPAATAQKRQVLDAMSPFARGLWIVTRVLGSVIVVPVVEELAFRGYLLRRIVNERFETVSLEKFAPLAWVISSIAFGALHASLVAGTIAGLLFALVAAHRGRLSDAIVAHAVANAGIAIAVLFGGHWWLWL